MPRVVKRRLLLRKRLVDCSHHRWDCTHVVADLCNGDVVCAVLGRIQDFEDRSAAAVLYYGLHFLNMHSQNTVVVDERGYFHRQYYSGDRHLSVKPPCDAHNVSCPELLSPDVAADTHFVHQI